MAAILGFFVTVAYLPLPDPARMPRWVVLSVLATLLLVLRAGRKVMPQRQQRRVEPLTALLAFLIYAAASLFWSPDPWNGVQLLWQFILFACVVALELDLKAVLIGMGCGLIVNAIVFDQQMQGLTGIFQMDATKPSGLFGNRNALAEIIAMAAVGLVALRSWWSITLAVAASLPLLVTPIPRGAVLALAAGFCAILPRWWRVGAAVVVVVLAAALISPERFQSVGDRAALWVDMSDRLTLLGYGLGSFAYAYPIWEFAHNDLMQIVFELGLPGLVAWLAFVVLVLWHADTISRAILVAFLVEGLFAFPLFHPATAFLAACAAGHGLGLRRARDLLESADLEWAEAQRLGPAGGFERVPDRRKNFPLAS